MIDEKFIGSAWYIIAEIALVIVAISFIIKEEFLTAFVIIILIELRDISNSLKNKSE